VNIPDLLAIVPGKDGKPYAIRERSVNVLQVEHAVGCPGGEGFPEYCNCTPRTWFQELTDEILEDMNRQLALRRELKRMSKYP